MMANIPWDSLTLVLFYVYMCAMLSNTTIYLFLGLWRRIFRVLGEKMYILFLIVLCLLMSLPVIYYKAAILRYFVQFPGIIPWLGLFLFLIGAMLETWAYILIGTKSAYHISMVFVYKYKNSFRLATDGPYHIVRHPAYLGELLMLAGFFLASGALSVLLMLVVFTVQVQIQVALEERQMRKIFGSGFNEYIKQVPRLVPTLCLRPSCKSAR